MHADAADPAAAAAIVRTYGPGPYYAVYMTGMVLPFGQNEHGTPYDPNNDDDSAELYAGPFTSWDELQRVVHHVPLADPVWQWGPGAIFAEQADVDALVAAKGPPRVAPQVFTR
jgi:hypothetical protein